MAEIDPIALAIRISAVLAEEYGSGSQATRSAVAGLRELVEDLVSLLMARRGQCASARGIVLYDNMLARFGRSRRWRMHVNAVTVALRRARCHDGDGARREVGNYVEVLVRLIVQRLVSSCGEDGKENIALTLERLGAGFESLGANPDIVLDPYTLVAPEIARRSRNVRCFDPWIYRDLVRGCLAVDCQRSRLVPLPLAEVPTEGQRRERLPGEHETVRGVTTKWREDQLKEVLPTEWALTRHPDFRVRRAGMERILNQGPLIIERFHRQHLIVRHRVLLLLVAGARHQPDRAESLGGHHRARTLAYRFLLTTALNVPRHDIEVDVAVFDWREDRWWGQAFPLSELTPDSGEEASSQNLLRVDRLLPLFFVRWEQGDSVHSRLGRQVLHETPSTHLQRAINRHCYDGVVIASIMRRDERHACLPDSVVPLPNPDPRVDKVLLASVSDGREDAVRGDSFRNLLQARNASMPLPREDPEDLALRLAAMVVGPVASRRRANGLGPNGGRR